MASSKVVEVDAENWEKEVVSSDELVVVDFWQKDCFWCKKLSPEYDELSTEYDEKKIKFVKMDVSKKEENAHIAIHNGVQRTPTIIFLCRGLLIGGIVGYRPKRMVKAAVDEVLTIYKKCIEQSTPIKV
jgi:thioredoxin 1